MRKLICVTPCLNSPNAVCSQWKTKTSSATMLIVGKNLHCLSMLEEIDIISEKLQEKKKNRGRNVLKDGMFIEHHDSSKTTDIWKKRQLTQRNMVYVHVCVFIKVRTENREKTQLLNLLLVQKRNSHVLVFTLISHVSEPCYFIA